MQILGNLLLALAGLLYVVPLQWVLAEAGRRRARDGGAVWGALFILGPLWLLLGAALLISVGRGGLDPLPLGRGSQYALAGAAAVALAVVSFFSVMRRFEAPSQLPRATRPWGGWGVHVVTLVALGFAFLSVNPDLAKGIPAPARQLPFLVVSAAGLLTGLALVGEALLRSQQRDLARLEQRAAETSKRDRDILDRLETLNPTDHFPELLGFSNRFETPRIREVALAKARQHPDFNAGLRRVLEGGWAEKGLVYLDACETPPPGLADAVRQAIVVLTEDARRQVDRTHTFYAEQFDWNTRLVLSVADKYAGQGVDFVPAITEFRHALDSPRTREVVLHARRPLDDWLARSNRSSRTG